MAAAGHRISSRIIVAISDVLVMELTEQALGRMGLTEKQSELAHVVIKSVVSAATAVMIKSLVGQFRSQSAESARRQAEPNLNVLTGERCGTDTLEARAGTGERGFA